MIKHGRDTGTVNGETNELRLTIETEQFTPNTLFWAARDARWNVTEHGDTTTFEVTLKGTEIQKIEDRHTGFGSQETTDWSDGEDDTADHGYSSVINFWLFDTSELPGEAKEVMSGMSVMTNAQNFGGPVSRAES